MKLWGKSKNGIWRRYEPSPMLPDAKKMGNLVISAAVPPERKMSRDPVRSLQSMAPCPKKEDEVYTANPNQISSSWLRLVEGVWVLGVSHHLDHARIVEALPPAGLITGIPPHTLLGSDQAPNPWDRRKLCRPNHWHRKLQSWNP